MEQYRKRESGLSGDRRTEREEPTGSGQGRGRRSGGGEGGPRGTKDEVCVKKDGGSEGRLKWIKKGQTKAVGGRRGGGQEGAGRNHTHKHTHAHRVV